jgi:hypothetical protein
VPAKAATAAISVETTQATATTDASLATLASDGRVLGEG